MSASTTGSAHARRRAELAEAADTDALVERLAAAGLADREAGWRRHFGRFHGDTDEWAEVVLESPTEPALHVRFVGDTLVVARFPDDPGLPGLAAVAAGLADVRVVRHRPGGRCTMSGTVDGVPRFVKVSPDARAIHDVATRLWSARRAGAFAIAVAEPLGHDRLTDAVHLGVVPGRSIVDAVLGDDGATWSWRVGATLGELGSAPLEASTVLDAEEHLARTRRAVRRAVTRVPSLECGLRGVVEFLEERHRRLERRVPVPVHGAPHASQWLADGESLGLVDFDRFSLGDPEADVATYLTELEYESDLAIDVDVHEQAVVTGFESWGTSLDPERLALYRLHRRAAKVARTTFALRPDGDHRAARHLAALTGTVPPG